MNVHSSHAEAAHWVSLATADLAGARVLAADSTVDPRLIISLAHQSVEKAVKSLLAAAGEQVPRTHDLVRLAHLAAAGLPLPLDEDQLRALTDANAAARYPEPDDPPYGHDEAAVFVEQAASVLRTVVLTLGGP